MDQPLYRMIAEQIERQIRGGELGPGAPIPSQLELASQYGVSVVTMQKALGVLVKDGLIHRIRRRGSFVAGPSGAYARQKAGLPVNKVYFVHNGVSQCTLSLDIHRSCFEGMAEACGQYGLPFAFHDLRDRFELPDERDAGFIFWGFSGYDAQYPRTGFLNAVKRWRAEGRHLAVIHQYFRQLQIPHVNCDNFSGAYLATQHLLSLGHTRIGIILTGRSKVELNPEFVIRLQGYRMALSNAGIKFDEDLISVQEYEVEEAGYAGFRHLMARSRRPTGVFATSDIKALGALQAAVDMGLSVPVDVSVIGYDGYRFGEFVSPGLTTVDQDFASLGRQAVHVLLNVPVSGSTETLVPPRLVVRRSTGACKSAAEVYTLK